MGQPQMTTQTLALLAAILADPTRKWYGLELAAEAGLKSGTIYPILARLEGAGWLSSSWEHIDPKRAGRPRRRLYRLTAVGHALASAEVEKQSARLQLRPKPVPTPEVELA
jgi:PadR family transcriptional regulator PadR